MNSNENFIIEQQEPLPIENQHFIDPIEEIENNDFDVFAQGEEQHEEEPQYMEDEQGQEYIEEYVEEPEPRGNRRQQSQSQGQYQETEQEIQDRKAYGLIKLRKFYEKGYFEPKKFLDMSNSVEEIEGEVELCKKSIQLEGGLEICRGVLMTCVYGIEGLTKVYNPDSPLKGWSKQVNKRISSYDEVLSELYIKWSPTFSNWGPEMTLLFLLTFSATNFIMSSKSDSNDDVNWMSKLQNLAQNQPQTPVQTQSQPMEGPSEEAINMFDQFLNNNPEVPAKKPRKPRKPKAK